MESITVNIYVHIYLHSWKCHSHYISINTESIFPPLSPAMILYRLLFPLVGLSPLAIDWPWSYAVQGITHYSWILFHLLLWNIIKFKPRISKFCTIYNHLYFCYWVEAVKTSIYMILKYVIYLREMLLSRSMQNFAFK